jgi:lipopolysaccharide/colanic/teichoic acid biosynthesis glycosyltransferase
MSWLALLVAASAVNLLVAEIFDWCPWLAERLIRRAVRKLPTDVRERYLDEWLAELEAVPGRGVSSLVFAVLVLAGASKVCHEVAGSPRSSVAGLAFKRTIDAAIALASLFFVAPVILCVVLAVRVSSPGPIMFRSMRRGIGQKRFACLTFRTMHSNAGAPQCDLDGVNEASGALFRIRGDPWLTPIGRLLRRFSMDGLPQLVNVLRGEMSLVGPRPLRGRDHDLLEERHHKRYVVKPGITGLAQLHEFRGPLSVAECAELDLYYVDHRSLWLDLKILALTLLTSLRKRD